MDYYNLDSRKYLLQNTKSEELDEIVKLYILANTNIELSKHTRYANLPQK